MSRPATENGERSLSASSSPPRANSSASLTSELRPRAALYTRPSWRYWTSFTAPLVSRCNVSARNMMEVSGERRSCAISTSKSRPSGASACGVASAVACCVRFASRALRTCSSALSVPSMTAGGVSPGASIQPRTSSVHSMSASRWPRPGEGRGRRSVTKLGRCWSAASARAARNPAMVSESVPPASGPSSRQRRATRRVAAVITREETPATGSSESACVPEPPPGGAPGAPLRRVDMPDYLRNPQVGAGPGPGAPIHSLLPVRRLRCKPCRSMRR